MRPREPHVAVVVINWNRLALTRACLRSLASTEYRGYRVIVVDNGSTDGSAQLLPREFPECTWLLLPENTGFTGGANAGIARALEAGVEIVVLLNNDAEVVEALWLRELVDAFEADPRLGIAGGTEVGSPTASRPVADAGPELEPLHVSGALFAVRRAVLETVGAFDPRYFAYWEDADLCARARRAGWRIARVPRAVVLHHGSRTATNEMATYYGIRNRIFYEKAHAGVARWLGFVVREAWGVARAAVARTEPPPGWPEERGRSAAGTRQLMGLKASAWIDGLLGKGGKRLG